MAEANKITSPIPLLAALWLGIEAAISTLAYLVRDMVCESNAFILLVSAAVILPIIFIAVIYRLISKHHKKLYAPRDFENSGDFFRSLDDDKFIIESLGRSGVNINKPFNITAGATEDELESLYKHAELWEKILNQMNAEEFFTLHSWFNETNNHPLALICIDVSISRGNISSSIYSFRSATLRKLGRLGEARHSANMALDLDSNNIDAKYNLAKIYQSLGERNKAKVLAKEIVELPDNEYKDRLVSILSQP